MTEKGKAARGNKVPRSRNFPRFIVSLLILIADYNIYNFLTDDAQEALPEEVSSVEKRSGSSDKEGPQGEVMVVDIESILITLEAGSYTSPIPLLKLQAALDATGFRSQKVGHVVIEVLEGSCEMKNLQLLIYFSALRI